MIVLHKREINESGKKSLANTLYLLLAYTINPSNNRIELNGQAMNTQDIMAYANYTRDELCNAMRKLYSVNAILNVRTKHKDFYYINPEFASDDETPPCMLDWLLDLFGDEPNMDTKDLVYFIKSGRNIDINIGAILPK